MIRSEAEYAQAQAKIDAERARLAQYTTDWQAKGYSADEIARLMEPLESFHQQLVEEVEGYERLKRGQFAELQNLVGLGQLLVGLRISRGLSQRQLAARLGTHESAVSRDERNEYHGITVERAMRILEALEAKLTTKVTIEPHPAAA